MDKIRQALWEDYQNVSEQIKKLEDVKSKENGSLELYEKLIEDRNNIRSQLKDIETTQLTLANDKDTTLAKEKQENKRNIFKYLVIGGLGLLDLGLTVFSIKKTFEFDKEQTFSSSLGKDVMRESSKPKLSRWFK